MEHLLLLKNPLMEHLLHLPSPLMEPRMMVDSWEALILDPFLIRSLESKRRFWGK